jgi:hypothetical protein
MMDQDFQTFWKAYPRKESKGQAYATWIKLRNKGILPPVQVIVDAINKRTKAFAWPEKTFIKHPSTWLNAWGWDDELEIEIPDMENGKPWHETWPGIQAKGAELGLKESDFTGPQDFRAAVMRKAMKAA